MSAATIEKPPLAVFAEQLAEKKAEQAENLVIFAWSGELDKICRHLAGDQAHAHFLGLLSTCGGISTPHTSVLSTRL